MSAITVIRALRNINFLKPNYGLGATSLSNKLKSGKLFHLWGPLSTAIDGKDSKIEEKDNKEDNPTNPLSPPSSTFQDILKSKTFIDKTALISAVFEDRERPMVLCTAPRRFGKTANLWMMQRFLEMEIDQNGKEKAEGEKFNRKMFSSSMFNLKVMENKEFVDTHFGKYPIINIDFVCSDMKSKSDAVDVCREAIRDAFRQHRYLYKSTLSPLENDEKEDCEIWCGRFTYKTIPDEDVKKGLAVLASYLYKFHQKEVFLLVDEYDSIISNALCHLKNANPETELEELRDAVKIPLDIIGHALKKYKNIIKGAYITGILDVAGTGISPLYGDVLRVQFGAYHPFQDFLGFSEEEVCTLFNRFEVAEELRQKARNKYNGYFNSKKERLYNPYSIVQFLKNVSLVGEKALQNYWEQPGYIRAMEPLFQADNVRYLLWKLLKGEKHLEEIKLTSLNLNDLQSLHNMLKNGEICSYEIAIRFLVSLGYLTYSSDDHTVQIPNGELSDEFKRLLLISFLKKNGLDENSLKACSASFYQLTTLCDEGDSSKFKKELTNFKNSLTRLLHGSSSRKRLNEATLRSIITMIGNKAGFNFQNEINIENINTKNDTTEINKTRADVVLSSDIYNCGVVIELKCGERKTSEDALKQLFNKQYYNVFQKDDENIPLSLVMGICVNFRKQVSVMCLCTKDIIHVLNHLKIGSAPLLEERIDMAFEREDFINNCCEKAKQNNRKARKSKAE